MINFDRKAFAKGVHDVLTLAPLRRLLHKRPEPPVDPYRGKKVYRCGPCSGKGTVALKECDFCGGTGWKRECLRMECLEYGCSGYFTCYEPRPKEKP